MEGKELRQLRRRAVQLKHIRSAAQQGLRMRLLLSEAIEQPVEYLRSELGSDNLNYTPVRASLEDVFVASTTQAD